MIKWPKAEITNETPARSILSEVNLCNKPWGVLTSLWEGIDLFQLTGLIGGSSVQTCLSVCLSVCLTVTNNFNGEVFQAIL